MGQQQQSLGMNNGMGGGMNSGMGNMGGGNPNINGPT